MSFITDYPAEMIIFKGRKIKVNPAFDVVLNIQNLYQEEELSSADKLDTALAMLGVSRLRLILMSLDDKSKLLEQIYEQCINIKQRPEVRHQGPPVLDFDEDAEYIYASFMSDYGIDLVEVQGKLSWRKFVYLFQGLTDSAKIKEVMRIRGMEMPAPTKYNQKQRQSISELKSYYALPVKGGGGQDGLDRLFNTLERLAGG